MRTDFVLPKDLIFPRTRKAVVFVEDYGADVDPARRAVLLALRKGAGERDGEVVEGGNCCVRQAQGGVEEEPKDV